METPYAIQGTTEFEIPAEHVGRVVKVRITGSIGTVQSYHMLEDGTLAITLDKNGDVPSAFVAVQVEAARRVEGSLREIFEELSVFQESQRRAVKRLRSRIRARAL